VKGQAVYIFGFTGCVVCATAAQLCHPDYKAARQCVNEQLCITKVLFMNTEI
jgi:hypothetical protein